MKILEFFKDDSKKDLKILKIYVQILLNSHLVD